MMESQPNLTTANGFPSAPFQSTMSIFNNQCSYDSYPSAPGIPFQNDHYSTLPKNDFPSGIDDEEILPPVPPLSEDMLMALCSTKLLTQKDLLVEQFLKKQREVEKQSLFALIVDYKRFRRLLNEEHKRIVQLWQQSERSRCRVWNVKAKHIIGSGECGDDSTVTIGLLLLNN